MKIAEVAEDQDHFLMQSSLHLSILVRNCWGEGKSERRVFMNKVQKSSEMMLYLVLYFIKPPLMSGLAQELNKHFLN